METIKGGQRPSTEPKFNVLRSLFFAEGGKGKSTAALTFPPPFFVLNCDKPIASLLEQLPESFDITYERVAFDDVDSLTSQMAKQYLAVANRMIAKALAEGAGGTLFIDGGDNLHEAVKMALLPSGDVSPRDHASVNSWWDTHFRRLANKNINWVCTSFAKPEWIGATKTSGRWLPEGWKWMKRWMEQAVYMYTRATAAPDGVPPDRAEGVPQEFRGQIAEAKERKAIVGRTMPRVSYKLLYKLYFDELPPNHERLWTPEYR